MPYWEIEEIPGCQAQNDRAVVASAHHTNQPHYARSEVLTTIVLKIWGSKVVTMKITLFSDVTPCSCLPNYNASQDRKEYFSTTLSSHPFQVFLNNVITPVYQTTMHHKTEKEYFSTTLYSHPFQVFLSNVITPISLYWLKPFVSTNCTTTRIITTKEKSCRISSSSLCLWAHN